MELKKINHIHINPDSININRDNIYYQLGYKNSKPDDYTINITEEYIIKCLPLIYARGDFVLYKIEEIDKKSGSLKVEKSIFNINKIIASQIFNSEHIAIFAGTIGKDVENLSSELLSKKESLEGYVVNLIGSEAAESAAEYIHFYIKNILNNEGLNVTNRFSPGYCGWNVADQFKLFGLLSDNACGISLTESALMHPVKSVSGIIGTGKNVRLKPYNCSRCKVEDCLYRNISKK